MRRERLMGARLALCGFALFMAVVTYLPHTDDGCVVETHCLACRVSVGNVATATAPIALPIQIHAVELVPPRTVTPPEAEPRPPVEPRGPPPS